MKKKISATILFGTAVTLALGFVLNPINSVTVKAFTGTNELVSVDSSEAQSSNHSQLRPSISQDGRYVVFRSTATNLVAGDTNGAGDIFLRDRTAGTTIRVSVSSSGVQANSQSMDARISESGKYVVYASNATNLIDGSTLSIGQVYRYDVDSGVTAHISQSISGGSADTEAATPDVSTDGRFVSFQSRATNLVSPGAGGTYLEVYVRDTMLDTTRRITNGNGDSIDARIDCGGRFAVFSSSASNLVGSDANGYADVFLADMLNGISTQNLTLGADQQSVRPSISCNGNYVSFESAASNVAGSDTNSKNDVFRYDRLANSTALASLTYIGAQANSHSAYSDISGDGRYVVFHSEATNLVSSDTNAKDDVALRDMTDNSTVLLAGTSGGQQANGLTWAPAISADGVFVAYWSDATNLTTDANNKQDIFVSATGEDACTF